MKVQKTALLAASFGTAHADTRSKTIAPLEEQIRAAFPERRFYRCYTSPTVRRLMERREGIRVDGPVEAFERMAADGMEDILIFVTHVIPGIESEHIAQQTQEFQNAHPEIRVRLTKPLLWEDEDYRACADILMEEYGKYLSSPEPESVREKTALIFFGHGTPHAGDACYERLETAMRREWLNKSVANAEQSVSQSRIYVVTIEGGCTVAELLPKLKADGVKKAFLIPLLLTAGEHVMHDVAGDEPNSAKSLLQAEGIDAIPVKKGIGEYETIRAYYIQRCRENRIPE